MTKWCKLALPCSAVIFVLCAYGQSSDASANPFRGVSETGQTVHVLPPPAVVHISGDQDPLFAPVSNGTSVYRPSYGVGKLRDHGGPEISGAGFQAIYWNSSVAGSTSTSLGYPNISVQIDAFVTSYPDGHNWDNSATDDYAIIQQYGSHGAIANTLTNFSYFVDSQATAASISDSAIQTYLAGLLNAGKLSTSYTTIYGVYFPAGMKVTMGGQASCTSFCGYHSHFAYGGHNIKYAVFPYPNCSGCSLTGMSAADMFTIISSHEIREAVTDSLGSAWYDVSGFEADDKCAWHHLYQMKNGGFWVQPEYSNGGTSSNSGFTATYPGPGCVVP
jgi:hypothetical protein